jgi:hypothetical protein
LPKQKKDGKEGFDLASYDGKNGESLRTDTDSDDYLLHLQVAAFLTLV